MKKELQKLQSERIPAVDSLKTAREMGDLSENAAYSVARSKLSSIDSRIRKLHYLIKTARISPKSVSGYVQIGSKVTIVTNGVNKIYTIVGTFESDPSKGKISYVSPLGKLLLGKKKCDKVALVTQKGVIDYQIVSVD